jgi:hypothetical protein
VIRRLTLFLFTIVAMLTGVNFVCQAQTQSLMTRHVREATLNGQAPFVKKLPATQSLRLDVVLPIRNQSELDSFLRDTIRPAPRTGNSLRCPSLQRGLVPARRIMTR